MSSSARTLAKRPPVKPAVGPEGAGAVVVVGGVVVIEGAGAVTAGGMAAAGGLVDVLGAAVCATAKLDIAPMAIKLRLGARMENSSLN